MARFLPCEKFGNEYFYLVEDLRNGHLEYLHGFSLKLFSDSSLDEAAITSHVFLSETGMVLAHLMGLKNSPGSGMVQVRWKGVQALWLWTNLHKWFTKTYVWN